MTGGDPQFSFAVPLDTGSSGCVLAYYMADGRSLLAPGPGRTYSDVGIGGTETFNVSQPTQLKMSSVALERYANSENIGSYASFGNYNFEVRRQDPNMNIEGFLDPVYVNVVGTPVLNKYTMHVQTNGSTFLITSMAGSISATGSPTTCARSTTCKQTFSRRRQPVWACPLARASWVSPGERRQRFTRAFDLSRTSWTDPPVSTLKNPTLAGVTLTATGGSCTSDWLFDSGAAVTMIGETEAAALGLLTKLSLPRRHPGHRRRNFRRSMATK